MICVLSIDHSHCVFIFDCIFISLSMNLSTCKVHVKYKLLRVKRKKKNTKCHTIHTVPKSNRIDKLRPQTHMISLYDLSKFPVLLKLRSHECRKLNVRSFKDGFRFFSIFAINFYRLFDLSSVNLRY